MKKLLTTLLFCTLFLVSFSQSEHYAKPAFPYHATAEEQQMLKTWYRNVKDGPVPTAPVTAIAEFQPMGGVMVAYPLGIPVNLVSELSFITKVFSFACDCIGNRTDAHNRSNSRRLARKRG